MGERVFFPFSFSLAEVSCRPDVRQHQLLLGAALTRGFGGAGKKRSLVQHHRPSLMGVDDKVRSFPGRVNVREIFQVQRPLPVSGHRPRQYQTGTCSAGVETLKRFMLVMATPSLTHSVAHPH
jgi:hypothetical protein